MKKLSVSLIVIYIVSRLIEPIKSEQARATAGESKNTFVRTHIGIVKAWKSLLPSNIVGILSLR